MIPLKNESVVVRNNEVLQTDLNQETVLFDYEAGSYFGLNPVASEIWKLTESEKSVKELCDLLCAQFEVTPEQCKQDVTHFLNELLEKKLLILK